jgi:tryptophan synthase alpha chain
MYRSTLEEFRGLQAYGNLAPIYREIVARVRKVATQPLCVGFGISTPEQARQVARIADGVIVGSRIIQLMEVDDDLLSVSSFTKRLRHALDGSRQSRHQSGTS